MRLSWIIHRTPLGNVHALGSRFVIGRVDRRWQVLISRRNGRRISFGWGKRP